MSKILAFRFVWIISGFCLMNSFVQAQDGPIYRRREKEQQEEQEKKELLEKLFVGGNLSLGFSGYNGASSFSFYISPVIGYHVTDKFNVAAGPLYSRYSLNYGSNSAKFTQNIWGGRIFAQYQLINSIYIHAEYESMNVLSEQAYQQSNYKLTQWIGNPMIGVAFVNNSGERFFQSFTLLYNTNWNVSRGGIPISPYGNIPIVTRLGLFYTLK
jgi:hypothetical protein